MCYWLMMCMDLLVFLCKERRPYGSSYFFLHALPLSVLFPRVFLTRKSACTFPLLVLAYYGIKHARWDCRDSITKHEKEVAPFCYDMFSQSLQQRKRSEEVCLVLGWVIALLRLWFPFKSWGPNNIVFSCILCFFFFFEIFFFSLTWVSGPACAHLD